MAGVVLRVEEFHSLTVVRRSDTSQIVEENIPFRKAEVMETRGIHAQVDPKSRCSAEVAAPGPALQEDWPPW